MASFTVFDGVCIMRSMVLMALVVVAAIALQPVVAADPVKRPVELMTSSACRV
jgi:hypothetical protein